ncbi:hypothetical protein DV736_g5010, partial [Chaetothyriales sp. CBS 134916]
MPTAEPVVARSDSAPSSSAADRDRAFPRDSGLLSRASRRPSDPSDFDWVSPFTLPPLPALRRARDHGALKSPEQLRHRDDSGAYYAAAWGSPYASPSPSRVPSFHQAAAGYSTNQRSRSPSIGTDRSAAHRRLRHSVDLGEAGSPEATGKLRARKQLRKLLSKSERPNWLSDSESSGEERGIGEQEPTPKSQRRVSDWSTLPVQDRSVAQLAVHQASDSLDTVTPDTFCVSPWSNRQSLGRSPRLQQVVMEAMSSTEATAAFKSLPNGRLPRRTSLLDDVLTQSPQSPSRPRLGSVQSFQQRPKKKVTWNGRSVVIALPMTDRESLGLPPILTAQELREKLDGLVAQGWHVSGFDLAPTHQDRRGSLRGQSRPGFPPAAEIDSERKQRQFTVHIPNQQEWEDWISYLQEEKLRALGVSPSSSEAPPSVVSPLSQSLSRPSSKYTGPLQSPPIAPSSVASDHLRAISAAFSPPFSVPSVLASQVGAGASSKYNAFLAPVHAYKHSLALGSGRGNSPLDLAAMQPTAFVQPRRSPADAFVRSTDGFSPVGPQGIRSLNEVFSPVMGTHAHQSPLQPNALCDQFGPPVPIQPLGLSRTPTLEQLAKKTPVEIQHPTPRSHRHNLSAALQKEIDDAEAALAKQLHQEGRLPTPSDEMPEDDVHDELPILRRPEIVDDEKSDIITNPSVSPSPLLDQDKTPVTNWQTLSNAALGPQLPSYSSHKPQPSLARLNVQAKEFDPKADFQSSNFSFTGSSFQPMTQPFQSPIPLVRKARGSAPRQASVSRFNVEAPSFVPRGQSTAAQDTSQFNFSSSSFNVDAPEFHPDKSTSKHFDKLDSTSESGKSTSIFGSVQIVPNSKVQRRAAKSLQVARLRSNDRLPQSPEPDDDDDDDRRIARPAARTKRVRRGSSDDDRSPVFAPKSVLTANIASALVDESDADRTSRTFPQHKVVDGWAYVPADEAEITHEKTAQSPLPLHSPKHTDELQEIESPLEMRDQEDEEKPTETVPTSPSSSKSPTGEIVEVYEELSDMPSSPIPFTHPPPSHNHNSSLSTLTEPFVFMPKPGGLNQSHSASQARTVSGLAASRWAVSRDSPTSPPSPPSGLLVSLRSHAQSVADPATPLSHPDLVIEDETDEETLRKSVKVIEDPLDDSEDEASLPPTIQYDQSREATALSSSPQYRHDEAPSSHAGPARPSAAATVDEEDALPDDDRQPSFEEIDAVMKQFENNPELGIERHESPLKSAALVDMQFEPNIRSRARSFSPRRNVPQTVTSDAASAPPYGLGIGVHRLNSGKEESSDWDDDLSTTDEARVQSRARFFDRHVKHLVDGALENRLAPLEHTLHAIQHSLSLLATKPHTENRLSIATDIKDSDADDEDDHDAHDAFSAYQSRAPEAKRNRRTSRFRAAVAEAIAAYKENLSPPATTDLSIIMAELAELRKLVEQPSTSTSTVDHLKDIKDAPGLVNSFHPPLHGSHVQQGHEAVGDESRLQTDGLETMLKHERDRANHESLQRQKADEEIELLKQVLEDANAQAAEYKEASEQAGERLVAFIKEKEAYRELEHTVQDLEKMIEEHRKLKEELEDALEDEKQKTKELARTIFEVKDQLTDRVQRCHSLHSKVDRLREQISTAASGLAAEQSESRTRENELKTKVSIIENALDKATRHAEKVQLDMDALERQHKEALTFKDRFENLQVEYTQAQGLIALLRNESRGNEDKAYRLERQLNESQSVKDTNAATTIARLTAELDASKTQFESYKAEAESQVVRLQLKLDLADQDFEDQKVKHDTVLAEIHDSHANTIRELNEKHEQAVEELHAAHDRKLGDLRDRHTRAMHNSSDDRHRMEYQFNEKLSLADDKIRHLESKVSDLTDRLEITKSAARAAVEAATAKVVPTNNLPTPANSVIASPPTRAASGSLSIVKGEPEKVSVQSLRESIMVLQEQLQNREQKIELLVAEIRTLDPDALPNLKEGDTEIQWLRELLAVRMDEIQELIATLSLPDFDQNAVKDAAIRLKANIEMEQSIREKSTTRQPLVSAVPTLSHIAAYAQSPRQALPLVANAAWGNLRRAKQYAGDAYESYVSQTPSKSSMNSQASFFSSVMTPPGSVAQLIRTDNGNNAAVLPPPPAIRPLAAGAVPTATARKSLTHPGSCTGPELVPRPLRGYSGQARTLSKKSNSDALTDDTAALPSIRSSSPQTPTSNPRRDLDLGDDVDEDASPLSRTELQPDETEIGSR